MLFGDKASDDNINVDDILRDIQVETPRTQEDIDKTRAIERQTKKWMRLWKKTAGFRTRDPLYMIPQRNLACDKQGFTASLFANRTTKVEPDLNCVLNEDAVWLVLLFADLPGVLTDKQKEELEPILKILSYQDKIIAQEHRIGSTLQFGYEYKRWVFSLDTLLFLAERNFWANEKCIRKKLMEGTGGAGNSVRTRFGFGDTRLKLGYKVFDTERLKAVLGVTGIFPTSRFFNKDPNYVINTKPGDSRKKLINDLMNVSKYIMINPKLGAGNWGVGGFFDARFSIIPNNVDIWGRFSYDHFFPATEYRFMPTQSSVEISDIQKLISDDKVGADFPLYSVFPALTKGSVTPGDIFNGTVGIDWKFGKEKRWKFGLGYDFYLQQAEKARNLKVPTGLDLSSITDEDFVSSKIVHHKIFADVCYNRKGKHRDWNFGIGGDMTFSGHGAPKDWTIFGKIGITF